MSYVNGNCATCDKAVVWDENPYENTDATRYWQSVYEKVDSYLFVVQRKMPYKDKKGRVKVQTLHEYVISLYCSPECGLKYDTGTEEDNEGIGYLPIG